MEGWRGSTCLYLRGSDQRSRQPLQHRSVHHRKLQMRADASAPQVTHLVAKPSQSSRGCSCAIVWRRSCTSSGAHVRDPWRQSRSKRSPQPPQACRMAHTRSCPCLLRAASQLSRPICPKSPRLPAARAHSPSARGSCYPSHHGDTSSVQHLARIDLGTFAGYGVATR